MERNGGRSREKGGRSVRKVEGGGRDGGSGEEGGGRMRD